MYSCTRCCRWPVVNYEWQEMALNKSMATSAACCASIVIEGKRVRAVNGGSAAVPGTTEIDLHDQTCLPGSTE